MIRTSQTSSIAGGEDFPRWEINSSEVCARIEKVHSTIKIVVKTKNDPFFIERWIKHHARIVGSENLIVFDNMSDDPAVLSTYRGYRKQLEIIRYADFWFNLHHTYIYGELYRALAKSSDYFIFLDADEFLILIGGDEYYNDDRVVAFVKENNQYDLFPASWLSNLDWSTTKFRCGPQASDLAQNLACGKPLIRSVKLPLGYVNHNFQLSTKFFAPPFKANLFLLHLSRLFPQKRIAANVNKLIVAGIATQGESAESIARRTDITDKIMAGYVAEIRDCLALDPREEFVDVPLAPGCVEMSDGGDVTYYGEVERKLIADFIADPRQVYGLLPSDYRLKSVGAADLGRPGNLGKLYV
jgi:hypothetical protein